MFEGDRFMRRTEVSAVTALSRSSIYKKMDCGEFPRPIRIGTRAVAWPASRVYAWMESQANS